MTGHRFCPGSLKQRLGKLFRLFLQPGLTIPCLFLAATILTPGVSGLAQTERSRLTPEDLDMLEAAIRDILQKHRTNAAGVALIFGDEPVWARGIGTADVASGRKANEQTLFRIGSISKMFVSLAALKLQEEGKLRLEQTLKELAPEIAFENPWEATDPVRLVHLLEHTAGFDDIHLREYAHNDPGPVSLREGLGFNPKSRTSRWPPGRFFSYSNSGPALAAYVVQEVSGVPFEAYIRANFLDPLKMPAASYLLSPEVERALATGYYGDGTTAAPYWHILMRPSGALNTSPIELANLVRMLIHRGTFESNRLLTPESVARMETPQTTLAAQQGLRTGYGLGNFTSAMHGFLFHGHDGGVNAYLSSLGYLPTEKRGYVVMINSGNSEALNELRELLSGYLVRDLEPPRGVFEDVPPERIIPLVRYYEPITPRLELTRFLDRLLGVIRIDFRRSTLEVSKLFEEKASTLIPVTDRRFRGEKEPLASMAFIPVDSGGIILQGFGKPVSGNYRAVSGVWVWLQRLAVALFLLLMLSSVAFALAWIPRRFFSSRPIPFLRVRVVPLLGVLCALAAFGILAFSMESGAEFFLMNMGRRTAWSVSFCVFTWLFAAFSVLGLLVAVASVRKPVSPPVLLHSVFVSIANVSVTAYLWYWGIVGLQSWT